MTIKVYIFSLIGIAILSVLIEIILPSGKMQKFIKSMFNLLIMCTFVFPILSLINNGFKIDNVFESTKIEVDSDFLEATNNKIYAQMEENIKTSLSNIGYNNIDVKIYYKIKDYETIIEKIEVDIKNVKININKPHKEIKQDIINVLLEYNLVLEQNIVFLE